MNPTIYQRLYGNEFETLYVFRQKDKIRISCECLHGLAKRGMNEYNRDFSLNGIPRDSTCRHAEDLRKALLEGSMKKYKDVTPKE